MATDDARHTGAADKADAAAVGAVDGPTRLSRAAIWSLALSGAGLLTMCVGLGGLLALAGIYVGYRGVTAINSSDGRLHGIGAAIAGLTLGVVVLLGTMPATLIFAWQALPLLTGAVADSRRAGCEANLKAIGVACLAYSDDHAAVLPPDLEALVTGGYLESAAVLRCPANPQAEAKLQLAPGLGTDYEYVGAGVRADLPWTNRVPILADWDGGHPGGAWTTVLFADGHVQGYAERSLAAVLASEGGLIAPEEARAAAAMTPAAMRGEVPAPEPALAPEDGPEPFATEAEEE